MITTNGWKVTRVKNPFPKKWPGPWFEFELMNVPERRKVAGKSHWTALPSYIGMHGWEEVSGYFQVLKAIMP